MNPTLVHVICNISAAHTNRLI